MIDKYVNRLIQLADRHVIVVLTSLGAAARIARAVIGGEHPVPAPVGAALRVFAGERVRHLHTRAPELAVLLPPSAGARHLRVQVGDQRARKHDHAVLATLAAAHDEHVALEIHVLDAQLQGFCEPQAAAVEHAGDKRRFALHAVEQVPRLGDGEHRGHVLAYGGPLDLLHPGQVLVEHLPVEKEQGAERLLVGRRRDVALVDQRIQERLDLRATERARMAQPAMPHEGADPQQVGLLGAQAVMQVANPLAHLVEQPGGLQRRFAPVGRYVSTVHATSIRRRLPLLKLDESLRRTG